MTEFERAAIYADLADSHAIRAMEAVARGDLDTAEQHTQQASEYFQAEHECLRAVQS